MDSARNTVPPDLGGVSPSEGESYFGFGTARVCGGR
jgi:hypothetical protein